MNEEGIVFNVNEAFTRAFGYTTEDLYGKSSEILFTPEDQAKGLLERELQAVQNTGQGSDNNYLVSKSGKWIWVAGETIKIASGDNKSYLLKIIQNINWHKESEVSYQHLNEFNENILSKMEDVVIVLNENLDIVKTNKAFIRLFGPRIPHITGMNISELMEPYDKYEEIKRNITDTLRHQKHFRKVLIEIETPQGEKRMFEVSGTLLTAADEAKNALLVVHDITIFKQLEREREDIMGFVAHELRNPLANLVLCNDLMEEALKENKINEARLFLQRSDNNVKRLNKMIAELYNSTKINSGNLSLEFSKFNFMNMVNEAIDTIKIIHPDYNIITHGEADIEVEGDQYRLIEVVTNYLSNGIKYSNGNTDVLLTVSHDNDRVTLSVKDEGLGIPKDQLPYIFKRFFRAERTRNLEGIGLGLYLCRRIIAGHQGRVWVESEENHGATFYFSIPVKASAQ